MAKTYTERPKPAAARRAWDMICRAIGAAPDDMTFGWAEHYGHLWTANRTTAHGTQIWGYSPSWDRASLFVNDRLNNF
jgi:hypothetical protein